MTVQSEDVKINHIGDAVQTVFPYTNILTLDEAHMTVFLDDVLQGSGYTVDGIGNPAGGNVTFDTAPASGVTVTLRREVPQNQLVDYVPYDAFPAEVHESALDLAAMGRQQLQEVDLRTLRYPPSYDPDTDGEAVIPKPVPNSYLNADEQAALRWVTGLDFVAISPDNETSGPLSAAVVETLPATPDASTLYFVTGSPVP